MKLRKEIIFIWEKIIKINPFSDEYQKDYELFLKSIIQDESFAKEETKKYKYLKNNKLKEKYNIYHNMFLYDTSSVLLVDGYLLLGKILYSTKNFSSLFSYYEKELLNLNIDNLIPKTIDNFHKDLIENAIKYDNINNIFNKPKDSLLKNKVGELFQIKLFVKPVPNLSYGLIYYNYIQKSHNNNYIIILDKELKIYGFTEIAKFCSQFKINLSNLKMKIIGYHIGLIIPDIFMILEYKDGQFYITKKNYELKGHFYPVEQINNLKIKIDNIIKKIKKIKNKKNGLQESFIEEPQNILDEYNGLIKEFNNQNIIPINIFFKVKLFSFLNGKYKYYRVYINNNILTKDNYDLSIKNVDIKNNCKNKKISIIKKKEKKIKMNKSEENTTQEIEKEVEEKNIIMKEENKVEKDIKIKSLYLFTSSNNNKIMINKIKNDIINKNKITQIKLIK